ncbi:EAL domain-containing protein [Pseudoduganella sp.]|uniref:EAL domain-containing protein n=1 Tax=Pseudoduganella sp. TaxID=1880898 RepID=UPI0035B3957E
MNADSHLMLAQAAGAAPDAQRVMGASHRAIVAESVLNNLKDVVFQTDAAGRWSFLNPAWAELSGHAVEDSLGKSFLDYVFPDDRELNAQLFAPLVARAKDCCRHQIRYLHRDGSHRWVDVFARLTLDAQDNVVGTSGTLRDITELKANEERLRFAASVFTHAGEGIIITDEKGTIIDVNRAFEAITGYTRAEATGKNPRMLSSGRQGREFYKAMWESLCQNDFWQGEVWNRRKSGEMYVERLTITAVRDDKKEQRHFVGIFSDITTQTLQAQHLEHIAHYDPLTGLPNRRLLSARLEQSMAQARRHRTRVAVAYLDLDGFKSINDVHGHEYGDELLVAVGRRLKHAVRECDTICRLGGDEFLAVLDQVAGMDDCIPLIKRIMEAVALPVAVHGMQLQVTCSLGLSMYPQEAEIDPDQLIRQADQAMYAAKNQGKNRFVLFETLNAPQAGQGRNDALEELEQALRRGEFVLYYQPIINLRTGELNSVEALIRWRHPARGLLLPSAFLPLMEGRPLALEVEDWVLGQAIAQHERWLDGGLDLPVSINMSGAQLQRKDFLERLRALLEAHPRVKPDRIKLEVLETSALEDIHHVSRTIVECAGLGVAFALDDFGTGFSSLLYLKQLPAERIKIDQSFVRNMLVDPEDLAILEGVIGMAEAFKRETIAEGVESFAHARMLIQLGCSMAQGYGIARPMPAQDVPAWKGAWNMPAALLRCAPIQREGIQLLVAGVEHRAWVARLLQHLREGVGAPPGMEARSCRIAQWLAANAGAPGDTYRRSLIEEKHAEMHRLAQALLAHGGQAAAMEKANDMRRLEQLGREAMDCISDYLDAPALSLQPVVCHGGSDDACRSCALHTG